MVRRRVRPGEQLPRPLRSKERHSPRSPGRPCRLDKGREAIELSCQRIRNRARRERDTREALTTAWRDTSQTDIPGPSQKYCPAAVQAAKAVDEKARISAAVLILSVRKGDTLKM